LRLEFEWLGRYVPVDVDSRDVSVVSSPPPPTKKRKRRRHSRKDKRHVEVHTPTAP
jgi:hypothetical protein